MDNGHEQNFPENICKWKIHRKSSQQFHSESKLNDRILVDELTFKTAMYEFEQ